MMMLCLCVVLYCGTWVHTPLCIPIIILYHERQRERMFVQNGVGCCLSYYYSTLELLYNCLMFSMHFHLSYLVIVVVVVVVFVK